MHWGRGNRSDHRLHYSGAHESELNAAFTGRLEQMFPDSVANLASVGAYDGLNAIYRMIEAAGADDRLPSTPSGAPLGKARVVR